MHSEQNLKFFTRIQQIICLLVFTLLPMWSSPTARAATILTLTVASNTFSPWT